MIRAKTGFFLTELDPNLQSPPSFLQFSEHEMEITETVGTLELKVNRMSGARGKVGIPFATEEGTAKAGKDFEHVEGELIYNNEENL